MSDSLHSAPALRAPAATPNTSDTTAAHDNALYRKVAWRLLPFLMACYVAAFLDRVNVGFAKLQMLDQLKFSDTVYGLGAGIFFIGYFLFEVPSNVLMHRIGAKKTLARIMVLWACILHGTDQNTDAVLHPAFPAGRSRGGLLSRHHPVPHLLVPVAPPRPGDRGLHDRGAGGRHPRRTAVGLDHGKHASALRLCRLAMDVPARGDSVGGAGPCRALVPGRQHRRGALAQRGRETPPRAQHRGGEGEQDRACVAAEAVPRPPSHPYGADLLLHGLQPVWPRVLDSVGDPLDGRGLAPGRRPADGDPERLRGRVDDPGVPAFRQDARAALAYGHPISRRRHWPRAQHDVQP
ncbi:protein of unknown function (plasmid) [Cupriavidus taiwanensis]|uniref:Major facilitator superfamily (MFS) profile domain-containing protein n=1 Tax=Cupriavidus taiwanensis TaxID=164546 RepID=A0A375I5M9_9BURK|nr:hypothetical protein CT19425_U350076 [Cupriavidus taiwanensis]SPK74912.1 protein of unknown function [Cupriavidus taiwanensis]